MDTLRMELAAAQQQRDDAVQQAEQLAGDLEQLRQQQAAGTEEQAQTMDTLRMELAAAQQQRDDAVQQAQQLANDVTSLTEDLQTRSTQLQQLEGSLVIWKEKVKSAKLKDSEEIKMLSQELQEWQEEVLKVSKVVLMLCLGECSSGDCGSAATWAATLIDALKAGQASLESFSPKVGMDGGWMGIEVLTEHFTAHLNACAASAKDAATRVDALEAEVLRLKESETLLQARCETAEVHTRNLEEELERKSNQAERVPELEQETTDLKTRCNLLRKELQRQREAIQLDRTLPSEPTSTDAGAPSNTSSSSAVQSALLLAAGGLSEREAALLVGSRDIQCAPLTNKTKLDQLVKENDELKRQNAHNNAVIAQYIKELGGYKANEQVQVSIEYLRNIVHHYLCAGDDLRPKMIPAICTVLQFNNKQKEDVISANPRCPQFH